MLQHFWTWVAPPTTPPDSPLTHSDMNKHTHSCKTSYLPLQPKHLPPAQSTAPPPRSTEQHHGLATLAVKTPPPLCFSVWVTRHNNSWRACSPATRLTKKPFWRWGETVQPPPLKRATPPPSPPHTLCPEEHPLRYHKNWQRSQTCWNCFSSSCSRFHQNVRQQNLSRRFCWSSYQTASFRDFNSKQKKERFPYHSVRIKYVLHYWEELFALLPVFTLWATPGDPDDQLSPTF